MTMHHTEAQSSTHRPLRRNRVGGNRSRCRVSRSIPALEAYKAPIPRLDPAYARLPFLPRSEGGGSGADQRVQPRARLSRVPHAALQARLDRSRKVPALRRLAVRFRAAHADRSHRSWTGDAACQSVIRLSPSESGPRAQALSCRQGDAEPVKVLATTRKLGSFGGRQPLPGPLGRRRPAVPGAHRPTLRLPQARARPPAGPSSVAEPTASGHPASDEMPAVTGFGPARPDPACRTPLSCWV